MKEPLSGPLVALIFSGPPPWVKEPLSGPLVALIFNGPPPGPLVNDPPLLEPVPMASPLLPLPCGSNDPGCIPPPDEKSEYASILSEFALDRGLNLT